MADQPTEKECCRRTRERWLRRIRAYFVSYPVIKDVPGDQCRDIVEIRVYGPGTWATQAHGMEDG